MTIQEAKEQIKRVVRAYLMKDEYGSYRIPLQRQRPIFLLGAPGIGKTAVMEQIAAEMDIAIVSYSMTHHTRQSALGLPFICHKKYQGEEFEVSEYTMSEIVASVYETMELSGKREGILFLDEINCVSETLAPSMLQFLQYKTFGRHSIPKGWIVATAGNPPQFNRSVREFDVVTLDRMKVLEVEADYDAWRIYGVNRGLHGSILTYLDIKRDDFYVIESTVEGKSYVTARGWEDLSETIYLYEELGFPVDETLVGQYLRNRRIAREFAAYYDLYRKYRQDYRVRQILTGAADADIKKRAGEAGFDERISLLGLLLDALQGNIRDCTEREEAMRALLPVLKEIRDTLASLPDESDVETIAAVIRGRSKALQDEMNAQDKACILSPKTAKIYQYQTHTLKEYEKVLRMGGYTKPADALSEIRSRFAAETEQMREEQKEISGYLDNLFAFVETTFGNGNEMLILVTDLTINVNSAKFISQNGCKVYFKYNKVYQLYERGAEIASQIEKLTLD